MKMNGTVKAFAFLTGLNVTAIDSTFPFDFTLTANFPQDNIFQVTTTSGNTNSLNFSGVAYSMLAYNHE